MTKEEYLISYCANNKCKKENCDICMYNKGRADAIDEYVKLFTENALIDESTTWTEYARKIAKQLKEQSNG